MNDGSIMSRSFEHSLRNQEVHLEGTESNDRDARDQKDNALGVVMKSTNVSCFAIGDAEAFGKVNQQA